LIALALTTAMDAMEEILTEYTIMHGAKELPMKPPILIKPQKGKVVIINKPWQILETMEW